MEFLKDNWFVVLIALVMIGFVSYFIYDQNKDNVTVKKADGQDVIATLTDTNITAQELYEKGEPFDGSLLYTLYKNAVIDQSVETTDDLKQQAKNMESMILSNAKSMYDDYEVMLTKELANYGYSKLDQLYDYCLVSAKETVLDTNYVDEHYEELKESVEANSPRTVSIITFAVANPDELTEEELKKQENIDKALESDDFASVATAFSEDTSTAGNEGFFGYVDSTTTSLDTSVVAAVTNLKAGETTDWIAVTDSSGAVSMYKAYVNEDDLDAIKAMEDTTIQSALVTAFINANDTLKADAIDEAAGKLEITFQSDAVKEKVEAQIASAKGEDSHDHE